MSAVMTEPVAVAPRAPRPRTRDEHRPSMARLTRVELRKMFDTRSGFWLPICVGVVAIGTVLITVLTGKQANHTFTHVFGNAVIPTAILLPLIGVLLVTGEFSQRTALTTFTLVPSRARVMVAKLSASVVCSVVALAFCLLVAAGATALHPASDPGISVWSLHAVLIPQGLLYLATAMITGVAFGAALLVSAPAIVIYLLLPTIWSALSNSISALKGPSDWLDASNTLDPMVRFGLGTTDWLQAGATLALWMVLPLAIGWWRVMRRDVG
jgi:ABC-type transport system involved in multi-copper enzyme maturation permease subunit